MTQTLTTEQLQEIYEAAVHVEATLNDPDAEFDLYCKLDEIGGVEATIRKLIDMMRAANREAQPVYQIWDDGRWYDAEEHIWRETYNEACESQFRIVYTAPPAPAVPDERKAFEAWFASDYSPDASGKSSMGERVFQGVLWHVWQARAMLAQPVSQGYKLPDGFKLMPIEMTDEIGEAIALEARCCGGIALCIYEAALAAAPEGGNG